MAATRVALLVRHYGARQMLALRRALLRVVVLLARCIELVTVIIRAAVRSSSQIDARILWVGPTRFWRASRLFISRHVCARSRRVYFPPRATRLSASADLKNRHPTLD